MIALAEVILRNAMAEQLAAAYGATWYARDPHDTVRNAHPPQPQQAPVPCARPLRGPGMIYR